MKTEATLVAEAILKMNEQLREYFITNDLAHIEQAAITGMRVCLSALRVTKEQA